MASVVSMKLLLEAGVHFGHQTRRWDPRMRPYIFTERNGIHIIDLQQTVVKLGDAYNFIRDLAAKGQTVVFVGTKKQAQESVETEAQRCGMFYVNQRWLGGMLTNFATIQLRLKRFAELREMRDSGEFDRRPKKEVRRLNDELARLDRLLAGIVGMNRLPGAVFVVDPHKERIAIAEARRLEIPLVCICDTNCNPDEIDYPIPANDDAIRAVKLLCGKMADAILEGVQAREMAAAKELEQDLPADSDIAEQMLARGEKPEDAEIVYTAMPYDESFEAINTETQPEAGTEQLEPETEGSEAVGEEA